jgi:predicted RNA-binding protein Jag
MARHQFEGRSAAEAAIKACEELGVTRSSLRYEVVSETGEGIEKRVVIAVDHEPRAGGSVITSDPDDRPPRRDEGAHESHGDRGPPRDRAPRPADRDRGGRGERSARSDRGGRDRDRGGRSDRGGRDRDRGGRSDRGGRGIRGDRDRMPRRQPVPQEADDGFEALLHIEDFPDTGVLRPELTGDISAKATHAKTMLNDVLARMKFDAAGVIVQDDGQEIHLDIRGSQAKRVVGNKGEPLLSLQFLVNRMVSRENESTEPVVVLDVAGYRERRRAALADLAKKLAERAIAEHKVVKLSPMSAHDRRVFHLTLTQMGGVTTQSEGDGLFRRLLIVPAEFSPGGGAQS